MRNISASAGGGFSEDSIDALRKHTPAVLQTAAAATNAAYKRAVDFLSTQIGIPNAVVIPYSNQLTVLAEVFRRVEIPDADQIRSISQWFWRSSASGYFSGWNTGMMASDLKAIEAFASGSAKLIELRVRRESADIWETRQFRLNNAHAKLLAIVLAHYRPIDLLTGQTIDVSRALAWNNVKEFHHFFPRAYLKGVGVQPARANALANIVMLTSGSNKLISDSAPSTYLEKVEAAAGPDLERWLSSNLISKVAFEAAKRNDFDAFLINRAQSISGAIDLLIGEPVE